MVEPKKIAERVVLRAFLFALSNWDTYSASCEEDCSAP